MSEEPLRVALVAGESSGDQLGAGLIGALRERLGDRLRCMGVCGPAMRQAGCEQWFDAGELAVMGLLEVVAHLPRLLRLRRRLLKRLLDQRPDVYVGIDAPDFNLPVEARLHRAGIRTVHYVSPSVWAWRPGRAERLAAAADTVLCLLPFEPDYYRDHDVRAEFVGHPLADRIAPRTEVEAARCQLGLAPDRETLAVLPGSRRSELQRLGEAFAGALAIVAGHRPGLQAVTPIADPALEPVFAEQLARNAPSVPVRLLQGHAQQAIAAADAVLVASGTATLEALLVKRPMVVAYRVAGGTRLLLEKLRLLNIDHFALPNLLAGEPIVAEVLQDEVTAERLADEVLRVLESGRNDPDWLRRCDAIHGQLRRNASARAAEAVLQLAGAAR